MLIPLAGTAFLSVGRHPLAGLALGFASVASAFSVNMLIKPLDAVLTELTNDAIHIVNPSMSIAVTANLWFSIVSVIVLTIVIAVTTERIIEPRLNIGPLWLLLGLVLLVAILDLIFTPAIATWAIFAPVFVPLFVQLAVDPAAVLAAYRVGDGPINSITPLNPYFALVVGFARKYDRDAGVGTVVALMLPYVIWMFALWILLFSAVVSAWKTAC